MNDYQDSRIARLIGRRADAAARRKQIVDDCSARGDEQLSEAEDNEFRSLTEQMKRYDERIAELSEEYRGGVESEGAAAVRRAQGGGQRTAGVAGHAEQWREVHDLLGRHTMGAVDFERRAFVGGLADKAVFPNLVAGDYATAMPSILSLFQPARADAPTERVYRVATSATAGQVAEGAVKPDAGLTLEPVDVPMQKLAAVQKISQEFETDYASFVNQIPNELQLGIRAAENDYAMSLISADTDIATATATDVVDGVADALSTLFAATGLAGDGVVLNPADLAEVRKAKADTAGVYIMDPTVNGPLTLHGCPIVVSNSVASGTVYVGNWKSAGIAFTRDTLRLDVGWDSDDWSRNLRTMRIEERVGLGLTRPGHLVKLTVTAAV